MNSMVKKNLLAITLVAIIVTAGSSVALAKFAQITKIEKKEMDYDKIIQKGQQQLEKWKAGRFETIQSKKELKEYESILTRLDKWYEKQPEVEFASLIDKTMTIRFIDGFYNVIFLDLPTHSLGELQKKQVFSAPDSQINPSLEKIYDCSSSSNKNKTAVVLNPSEWEPLRGSYYCSEIVAYLKDAGYGTVIYRENSKVDIDFLKYNLSVNVTFNVGHGGHLDLDNDSFIDTTVLASGEEWSDGYDGLDEFIKGTIGGKSFVCYKPSFIKKHYNKSDSSSFPKDSLVFIAACYSLETKSMAKAFVDYAGAASYMGWKMDSVIAPWSNRYFSAEAFRVLCRRGYTINKSCNHVKDLLALYGMTFIKLDYYGYGELNITDSKTHNKKIIEGFLENKIKESFVLFFINMWVKKIMQSNYSFFIC